jgi:hypothetical protein
LFGVKSYNFSVASGILPGILARLQWLAGKGCMPGRVFIAMSIDRLQFPARPNDLLRKEYPPIVGGDAYYREFLLSYLGSDALFSNLGKAVERVFKRPAPRFRYDMRSGDVEYLWDQELTLPTCPAAPVATDILAIRRYAGYLRQIRDLADAHGAELTLVWNPISRAEQLAHLQDARQLFPEIEGVSDHVYRLPVTDPRLADGRYYHDSGHFKPELAVASVASPEQRVSLERLLAELESAGQACP